MYCKNCGKQLSDTDRFCPGCGSEQHPGGDPVTPPPSEPVPPPAGGQVPPPPPQTSNAGGLETVLKIFSIVCAVVFLLRSIGTGFGGLSSLFSLFGYFYFPVFLNAILLILSTLAGLWMVLVLILTALRRTPENTEALTFGVAGGGVLVLALQMLRFIVILIFFRYFDASFFVPMLGVVICVGGVYGLLYLMGEAPELESLLEDPAGNLSAVFSTAGDGIRETQARQAANATARAEANATAAAGRYTDTPYAQPGGGQPVKTDRSLVMYIILSIITCGIYSWYFIYSLARDVNIVCREDGQKTGGLLAFILLSVITCGFYGLYWMYSLGNRLAANGPRYGMNFQENGTTVLLWYLVGLFLCGIGPYVAMHILIKNSNALSIAYNRSIGF